MTAWIAVLALALATFAIAAFGLRLPRQSWALFGAILSLGLAGYAWQGVPDLPSSAKPPAPAAPRSGENMVNARRALFDPVAPKAGYLVTSDAFARRGRFKEAAGLLRRGLIDNPNHLEGWLALAMALVGHADGTVTPAALHAYGRARAADPASPGPDFFLGISYLQGGEVRKARAVWNALLDRSEADAPWRPELEARVAALDSMIANAPMLQR